MSYGKRIDTLCSFLRKAESFADVGCDHGYCSEFVLTKGLCDKVIFSDVSRGSLQKAQTLLARFVKEGRAIGVLGDGFYGVPKDTEEVLIAGMGGSEIVSILSNKKYGFIPRYFVFQPMHDSEKLRRYILQNGGYIERDFTFRDVKFYDVLVGGCGKDTLPYSEAEYEFGRENLQTMPKAFVEKIEKLLSNVVKYLNNPAIQEENRKELEDRKGRLKGVLDGEIK